MSCRNVDQTTGLFVSGVQELSTIFLSPSSQKTTSSLESPSGFSSTAPWQCLRLSSSCHLVFLFFFSILMSTAPTLSTSGSKLTSLANPSYHRLRLSPSTQDGLLPLLFLVMARRSVSVVRRISDVIPRQAQLVDGDAWPSSGGYTNMRGMNNGIVEWRTAAWRPPDVNVFLVEHCIQISWCLVTGSRHIGVFA